jgi:hypothetical protein
MTISLARTPKKKEKFSSANRNHKIRSSECRKYVLFARKY